MAGGQERELRRRIRSVESTKKITRAFELIAASQIARAQGRIAGARPYVEGIEKVLATTASEATGASRLIGTPEHVERVLLVVMVADRGLCGGYNSIALRTADRLMRAGEAEGREYRLVTVGRKAISYFRFRGREIHRSFIQMTNRPVFDDARAVAAEVVAPFLDGEVDVVQLVSWRFRSAGIQTVGTRQILPLPPLEPNQGASDVEAGNASASGTDAGGFYDFEPAPEDLLQLLVPQYAEAILYQALLEASASEHTARQRAMKAATENAEDFITTLRRVMNRVRQDAVTTEIMEIVGGAEALRQAGPTGYVDIDAEHTEEQIA
ncbi:MAG: synthase, gamma subunit [Acidimicrobiaceae bacterium]|jgi:F-type H+-transporting ATPase subunit gamma|nr:synthase, gamma subunit [Acidimicrobiaceae bacterium]